MTTSSVSAPPLIPPLPPPSPSPSPPTPPQEKDGLKNPGDYEEIGKRVKGIITISLLHVIYIHDI